MGYWCFETFTPIVEGTYAAARAAVDVALTGADLLLGGASIVYGLCRPPGHHVGPRVFGGSSYLNSAAIVAEHVVRTTGEPVAVLDLDFHHGNGTQQIFYERSDVLYVSIHGDPLRSYPYFSGHADETGAGPGAGATWNFPLPAGTDDRAYLATLDEAFAVIRRHGAPRLIVSLGVRHLPAGRGGLRAHERRVPRDRRPGGGPGGVHARPPGGWLLRPPPGAQRPAVAPRCGRPGVRAGRRGSVGCRSRQRRREPPSTGASRSRIDAGSAGGSAATSAMASAIARQLHRNRSGGMFSAGCIR